MKTYPTLTFYRLDKSLEDPPEQTNMITLYADEFMIGPIPNDGVYLIRYSRPPKKKKRPKT